DAPDGRGTWGLLGWMISLHRDARFPAGSHPGEQAEEDGQKSLPFRGLRGSIRADSSLHFRQYLLRRSAGGGPVRPWMSQSRAVRTSSSRASPMPRGTICPFYPTHMVPATI